MKTAREKKNTCAQKYRVIYGTGSSKVLGIFSEYFIWYKIIMWLSTFHTDLWLSHLLLATAQQNQFADQIDSMTTTMPMYAPVIFSKYSFEWKENFCQKFVFFKLKNQFSMTNNNHSEKNSRRHSRQMLISEIKRLIKVNIKVNYQFFFLCQ